MKALLAATGLVLLLISGVIVWALANGTPLSGEPHAVLPVKPGGGVAVAPPGNAPSGKVIPVKALSGEPRLEGRAQVLLDVTPPGRVKPVTIRTRSAGLIESSAFGPLPQRARDGRTPAGVYAKKTRRPPDTLPRIAILFTGLGLNQRLSQQAVKKLPSEVTLAFSAYGRKLPRLAGLARSEGHELMLQVPLEPVGYPTTDTGPKTLLVAQGMEQNRPRLHWAMGRFTGYFGIVNAKGGRFLADKPSVSALFQELHNRGLFFFRDKAAGNVALAKIAEQIGLGYAQATLEVDRNPTSAAIAAALRKLEAVARRSGLAVGVAQMHPVSINMISKWAQNLKSRGMVLVPVSAAYAKQGL